jgi:hypothetical protein
MSQLTIQTQVPGSVALPGVRRRPMRSERMVGLRSAMPLGLVTLRHDIPERLRPEAASEHTTEATPKVDPAERAERVVVETPARKGGEAQW